MIENTTDKQSRRLLNTGLYWLYTKSEIHDIENDRDINDKLNNVLLDIHYFTDEKTCMDYLKEEKHRKIFLVISSIMDIDVIQSFQQQPQLVAIYIYAIRDSLFVRRLADFSKVQGIYLKIDELCANLNQALRAANQDAISTSILKSQANKTAVDLNTIDSSFIYAGLFKTVILRTKYDKSSYAELLALWRNTFNENRAAMKLFDDFERDYVSTEAIRWYSQYTYLYSMLNQALRNLDARTIVAMGFFIHDLHYAIEELQKKQTPVSHPLTLYRGQRLSFSDFRRIKKSVGDILSFNCFLSTSTSPEVALYFTMGPRNLDGYISVIYQLEIDPKHAQKIRMANIAQVSVYPQEAEILISMRTSFRIISVADDEDVHMTIKVLLRSVDESDETTQSITKSLETEYGLLRGETALPNLLYKLGINDLSKKLYINILQKKLRNARFSNLNMNQRMNIVRLYNNLALVCRDLGSYAEALSFHWKGLDLAKSILPENHFQLTTSYNHMAIVYGDLGDYVTAFLFLMKAFQFKQGHFPESDHRIAIRYNNIAYFYQITGEYSMALSLHERALDLSEKLLPKDHPNLGSLYNNIALVLKNIGGFLEALHFHEKAIELWQRTLPKNHQNFALLYYNIALVYESVGDYSTSLSFHERALDIWLNIFSENHCNVAASYSKIGWLYMKKGDYHNGLNYCRKAIEIQERLLSESHPKLASLYSNIGSVYNRIGDFPEALRFCKKALKIQVETLGENHPNMISLCSNIGLVYKSRANRSKELSQNVKTFGSQTTYQSANERSDFFCDCTDRFLEFLSFYKKVIEIRTTFASEICPQFMGLCDSILLLLRSMGDNGMAILFYQRALEIQTRIQPENYSNLAFLYSNIGSLHGGLGDGCKVLCRFVKAFGTREKNLFANCFDINQWDDYTNLYYAEALSFHEKAIGICKMIRPENSQDKVYSYNTIALFYHSLNDLPEAISFIQKARDIVEKKLPVENPERKQVLANAAYILKQYAIENEPDVR